MDTNFERYFTGFLIPHEGEVYENVKGDNGGPTKFGIDQRSHPEEDIRRLTLERARAIYFEEYWLPIAGPLLPWPMDVVVMDIAVNCGRTTAIRYLQARVGATIDGRLGPKTLAAAAQMHPVRTAVDLIDRRQRRYLSIVAANPSQRKFLKGWLARNEDLKKFIGA